MKTKLTITLMFCLLISLVILSPKSYASQKTDIKTEKFKVYGNCEMCQENIETALMKKDGVLKKSWDPETKMLSVSYDASKITLTQIKQKIAAAGYDTDEIQAKDEAYAKLHKCCRYERAPKAK